MRPIPSRRLVLALLAAGLVPGCSGDDGDTERPAALVPVSGIVTLNGRPIAGAVVTFLPTQWAPGVGETDEEGAFTLSNAGRPGTMPGHYKVAVSLLLSEEGEPQGLEARSALSMPKEMSGAKEALPRENSDLGRTTLTADVGPDGGSFRFDLKADLPPAASKPVPPNPEPAKPANGRGPSSETKGP